MPHSADKPKVVVITGSAGALGTALVSEFSAQGWRVVAGTHKSSGSLAHKSVWTMPLDVRSEKQIEETFAQVVQHWGSLDVLVNNAGLTFDASLWEMDEAQFQDVLDVNLKGPFLCARAALRTMIRQRDGHIVNISSFSGRSGARGQTNYAAAKAGLFGLTASLAREAGSRNIRVNAVLPGILKSRMTAQLPPAQMETYARANALNRINSAEEVARFVAFLVTMQNASGQIFQLDSRIGPWT